MRLSLTFNIEICYISCVHFQADGDVIHAMVDFLKCYGKVSLRHLNIADKKFADKSV